MATQHPTAPARAGERYRLPIVAAGGPVTKALAIMAAADSELERIRRLRRAIADRIAADIELLDAIGGDPDFEPDADSEDGGDHEPSLGSIGGTADTRGGSQLRWSAGGTDDREHDAGDDCERDPAEREDDRADDEDARQPVFMPGGGYSAEAFDFAARLLA